jgi:hypothetical protein
MEVDILDPFSQLPIKKGNVKLPFPNPYVTILDELGNGIVLWCENDLVALYK